MRVHYAVKHLGGLSDRSGVSLWLARGDDAKGRRAMELVTVRAPVEIPCPSGIPSDASSPCSRDHAFGRLGAPSAAEARAQADALLTTCGTDLPTLTSSLRFDPNDSAQLLVPTTCTVRVPKNGVLRLVRADLRTRGVSVLVEAERSDGSFERVLDIPAWRWGWTSAYMLERGLPITAGKQLRVSCTFDNGTANQWSASTGEPGHGAPSRPPLQAPAYVVYGPSRQAEECAAVLGIEKAE